MCYEEGKMEDLGNYRTVSNLFIHSSSFLEMWAILNKREHVDL